MRLSRVDSSRSAFPDTSSRREYQTAKPHKLQHRSTATTIFRLAAGKVMAAFQFRACLPGIAGFILAGLFLCLIPRPALADQVTLAWEPQAQTPEGYRIYQRVAGQTYDYNHPVWPTDGADHTETSCTITNLSSGVTYYFVARAYIGQEQSSDSNEVAYQAEQAPPSGAIDDNRPPTAEAGSNKTVNQGATVVLSGSASSDPEGGPLTYRWAQVSGPQAILSSTNNLQCSFTAPITEDHPTTMVFELTVTDGKGLSSGDTCIVLVNPAPSEVDTDHDGTPDYLDNDDDNDGMPDDWEAAHLLDPLKNDAGMDADGDGISNLDEYQSGSDPMLNGANHPPQAPGITSPADGEPSVPLTPWIEASEYSDQDTADHHASTQWRILLASDTRQIVLNRTNADQHLSQMKVPRLVLDPSTTYWVQVRYFDNHGEPSPWSLPAAFTTQDDQKDKNRNQVPDAQEVITGADINRDSIPDEEQPAAVKSVVTYNSQHMMAVGIDSDRAGAEIQGAVSVDPGDMASVDNLSTYPDDDFPYGMLGYKIRVDQPGESVRATIHLSDGLVPRQTQWVCYDEINGMQDCSTATTMDKNGLSAERYITDGGNEDADGAANGVIIDLSGPRESNTNGDSTLAISTDGQATAGRTDRGCFIQTLLR